MTKIVNFSHFILPTINFSYLYDNFVDVTIVGGNNEHLFLQCETKPIYSV